ncbi:MAG: extracellular solute-binding protein [Clostridiales bacterium]|nr:extracellular solute-binding protein [Clostridiales bacterium]
MRRTSFEKVLSMALVFTILLTLTSCGKKASEKTGNSGQTHRTITSEDPWFDTKIYSIEPDLDTKGKEIVFREHSLVGTDDKYIVVFTRGYFFQSNFDTEYSVRDHEYCLATVVDRNTGEKIRTVDLQDYLEGDGTITDVSYENGRITSAVQNWSFDYGSSDVEIETDVLTGEVLEKRPVSYSDDFTYDRKRIGIGKYMVMAENMHDLEAYADYYLLTITDSEGKESQVELKKEKTNLSGSAVVLTLSEEKILFTITQTSANVPVHFEVDLKNAKAVEADGKEYDWIDFKEIHKEHIDKDCQTYFPTSDGISKIDMKNKRVEEFFNYDACSINHTLLNDTELVDCYDGKVILLGGCYGMISSRGVSKTGFDIYVLSKAKENPHAGKTLLELYAANGYVNHPVAEAILEFNEKNRSYFIEVTGRYTIDTVRTNLPTESQDDVDNDMLQANLVLNDSLAMDILSGSGPDILLLSGDMGRLSYSNYLVDLSKYFSDLDPAKYFANIFEAAKTDGKLYQVPVTFGIKGIHTDAKNAGASGQGFTTKEYEEFLYDTLSGFDLITSGQALYFTTLFNGMRDKFIVNGKADFSGPEFAELADYVKKNIPEKAPEFGSEDANAASDINSRIALYSTYRSPKDYLNGINALKGAKAVLGIPSTDGRGPQIESICSIAVSSQAPDVDACAEFVRTLLSDEVQSKMADIEGIPVNRTAFREIADYVLEYANSPKAENDFISYIGGFPEPDVRRIDFTKADMAEFEKIILSCSHYDSADPSIDMILIEEMPAYFLGQKDLPSVIKIITDRVQTVLNERGT